MTIDELMDVDDGLAVAENRTVTAIVDRLKAMVPDVTAPAMTRDELLNTIETKLSAGKALDTYLHQIEARLKVMTGVDIGNVDDGLYLIEAKIKAGAEAQAENAYMHRIMGRVKAKVNALLLNSREKITDVCQALDAVQAEYDHVKSQALKNSDLATARGIMISDAIAGLCEALGTPRTEDVTLAKITDLLKVKASEGREYHARLCEAVHVLTTTPMDRVVNETVRALGARDYFVRTRLSRLCPDVNMDGKTTDEVLAMIEAEQKTLTERLGTSYAREMTLVKELADAKTQLATAGKESADLARALHLAEDKINGQGTELAEVKHALGQVLKVHDWVMATIRKALNVDEKETGTSIEDTIQRLVKSNQEMNSGFAQIAAAMDVRGADVSTIVSKTLDVFAANQNCANLIKDLDGETHAYRKALGLDKSAWHGAIVAKIEELTASANTGLDPIREAMNMRGADVGMLVTWCESMRHKLSAALEQTRITHKRCVALGNDLNKVYDAAHVAQDGSVTSLTAKITRMRDILTKGDGESMSMIESLSKSVDTFKAERETSIRFFDDMRTVLGERNATPKYIVDTVDEMRRDMASIKSALGYPFATTREVLTQIGTQIKDLDRVRDAIGLRSDAPMDYVVQRIADTRRDLHWAQGTVSMVSAALTGSQTAERTEIMATLSGTIKGRDRAQEQAVGLYTTLCTDLNMPTTLNLDEIRDRVQGLITLRSNMRTFLGKDMTDDQLLDQVTHLISLRSEINSLIKDAAKAVGMDPAQTMLTLPALIQYVNACKDSLLALTRDPDSKILSLNAALSLVQSKVSGVALALGLSEYASLDKVGDAVKNLLKDRDNQARMVATLNVPIEGRSKTRERLLTLLCEDPNRAGTMTTDEVVDLLKSKFACLALNLSLPEDATLNEIMEQIQGMTPSALYWHDLASVLYMPKTAGVNEVLRRATDKIKALRDLLNF